MNSTGTPEHQQTEHPTPNTFTNLVKDVAKTKENLRRSHEISAQETEYTMDILDKHNEEIGTLKKMLQEVRVEQAVLLSNQQQNQSPAQYNIDTPPPKQQMLNSLMEHAARIGGANNKRYDDNDDDDSSDHGSNVGREPVIAYMMQFRAKGLDYNKLTEPEREAAIGTMKELIALANGLDYDDVEITLRQGSLIIDARVSMPASAGDPVTPSRRAVDKVLRDITQTRAQVDVPRMARADMDDELWRTQNQGAREDDDKYERDWPRPAEYARKNNGRKLPHKLDFEGAKSHALKSQNDAEERLARSQLRQPELSPDMEDWAQEKERGEEACLYAMTHQGMRFGLWNLVPERQVNLTMLRGEQDAQNRVSYSEWARDAKDHIKSKGKSGRLLVSMMEFAERLGDTLATEDTLLKLGVDSDVIRQIEHAFYMFIKNYTGGHACFVQHVCETF